MLFGEGGDDLAGGTRYFNALEGIGGDDLLTRQPGEEDAQAAGVAVDRVGGKELWFGRYQGMAAIARPLLQGGDEGADVLGAYLGGANQDMLCIQKAPEVTHGIAHGVDGSRAFALGGGAQLVTLQKGVKIVAGGSKSRRSSFTSVEKWRKIGMILGG